MSMTLLAPEVTTTDSAAAVDHYYCRKCWPEPWLYVRGFCGTEGPDLDSEIDPDRFEADCVVCRDFDGCPVCGHIEP